MTQRESETSEKTPMDFGELRNDTDFITKSTNLEKVRNYFIIFLSFMIKNIIFYNESFYVVFFLVIFHYRIY